MPMTDSHARGESSSVRAMKFPAALLTRMSRGPSLQIDSIIASTASRFRTSQGRAWIGPFEESSTAVCSRTSSRRPQMWTRAPSSRKRSAIPLPRPVPPPVIKMRLLSRRSGRNIGDYGIGQLRNWITQEPSRPFGDFQLQNYSIDFRLFRCGAEPVVGILKFRRNAGTGRAARDLDVVSPRTSAGSFARRQHRTLFRTLRIALGRTGVAVRVVPVAAPLMHVVADVVEAEAIWHIAAHSLRPVLPPDRIVGQRLRRIVSPGKLLLLKTAAGSALPLGLCRQAISPSSLHTQPFTIAACFEPGDSGHRLRWMIEVWIVPER